MNALENRIAELEATLLSAESALKIAEALIEKVEKERDLFKRAHCQQVEVTHIAWDTIRKQAEALRAAREALEAWLDDFNRDIASGNFVSEDRFEAANLTDKALAPAAPAPETKKEGA